MDNEIKFILYFLGISAYVSFATITKQYYLVALLFGAMLGRVMRNV